MSSNDELDTAKNKAPSSVLFLCAMNAIRSPMAEYLMKDIFGTKIYAQSAGVREGETSGFAIAAMAARGVDMGGHKPKLLDDLGEDYFDVIITLSPEAHHRAMDLTRTDSVDVEYWPTEDPSTVAGNREQVLEAYSKVRDSLEQRIRERFDP